MLNAIVNEGDDSPQLFIITSFHLSPFFFCSLILHQFIPNFLDCICKSNFPSSEYTRHISQACSQMEYHIVDMIRESIILPPWTDWIDSSMQMMSWCPRVSRGDWGGRKLQFWLSSLESNIGWTWLKHVMNNSRLIVMILKSLSKIN